MLGLNAGYQLVNGSRNTFIGTAAGLNNLGSGNVYIGNNAGAFASGDDLLYIENSTSSLPLISGNFSTNEVQINGAFEIIDLTTDDPLRIESQNESKLIIQNDGDIFIQDRIGFQTFNPAWRIHLPNNSTTGVGRAAAFAWETFSDQRVKKNIKALKYGLEEILALRPVAYQHINSDFKNGKLQLSQTSVNDIGFLAQEVHEVIQEIVNKM